MYDEQGFSFVSLVVGGKLHTVATLQLNACGSAIPVYPVLKKAEMLTTSCLVNLDHRLPHPGNQPINGILALRKRLAHRRKSHLEHRSLCLIHHQARDRSMEAGLPYFKK